MNGEIRTPTSEYNYYYSSISRNLNASHCL